MRVRAVRSNHCWIWIVAEHGHSASPTDLFCLHGHYGHESKVFYTDIQFGNHWHWQKKPCTLANDFSLESQYRKLKANYKYLGAGKYCFRERCIMTAYAIQWFNCLFKNQPVSPQSFGLNQDYQHLLGGIWCLSELSIQATHVTMIYCI